MSGWHEAQARMVARKGERRAPKVVCSAGCPHFKERERNVGHVTVPRPKWQDAGRPPNDYNKECLWFHTAEGLRATSDERLTVMLAGANGGVGCPVQESDA